MRLLMISGDRVAAQGKKGAFWYTLEELSKHWEMVDVICPYMKKEKCKIKNEKLDFENVFFHPSPHGLWYQPWWIYKKGRDLFSLHHHDVMTVHEYPPFYNGFGALRLANKVRIPFVLEIHHLVGWPVPASFAERIARPFSRIVIPYESKKSVAVRTVNETVSSMLQDFGVPAEKISTLPSFYLDSEKLKKNKNIRKEFDVVFAGRLVANKGLSNVLIALSKLSGVRLLVLGDGPRRKHEEALARRLRINNRVTFSGWLSSQEDVIAALQRAKIFALASKSEGGPRIALEAMACGMPVLSTPVGVMPDVIKNSENGLLTTGTPEDLAEKIALLLSDDIWRERMGDAALDIIKLYNKELLVKNYAEFLKSFAQESGLVF